MKNCNQNNMKHDSKSKMNATKARIYNLVIVDESGSMGGLETATMSGVNEIIQTIRRAQEDFREKQEHYLSLVTFDSGGKGEDVRTLMDAVPIDRVQDYNSYDPYGSTPLYDAIGFSLTRLHERIQGDENATAVVTILTDGMENASRTWTQAGVSRLISDLKEEGWSFSYMGSCHDVIEVSAHLKIDHAMTFSHDATGARSTWEREKASRRAYFEKMSREFNPEASKEDKKTIKRRHASAYYLNRVTPEYITQIGENEVFVFGSNPKGQHFGGAAHKAVTDFGARMGQGEGLQGRSYAIPVTEGKKHLKEAVDRFIRFAECHPEIRFLVTQVGCGHSGYKAEEVAPLFWKAVQMENVFLPETFWTAMGLQLL